MIEISPEEAVNRFSQLMQPYLSAPVNLRSLIETFSAFYHDTRITNASVEADDDMLLLECGTTSPHNFSGFTDLRTLSDKAIRFDDRRFEWIGLTRQVFAHEDEEAEFDGEAIALCAYVFFEESSSGSSSNLWITSPDELNVNLNQFLEKESVKTLIDSKPSLINAFVSYVG